MANYSKKRSLKMTKKGKTSDDSKKGTKRRGSRCYEILEALGLKRINVLNNENNPINLQSLNKRVQQDKNNNNDAPRKNKLHKCTRCNLTFTSSLKYNQHRKQNHPRSKILQCKICSKTFKSSNLLLRHKRCHSGDTPYCCVECTKTFATLQLLTAHIRQHAGKLPYTCKICKMGFNLYSAFIEHESEHLLRRSKYMKPRSFKCATCPREFHKLCDLERHTRVHTGEKPYVCKICKNRFQQAHNLTKHMIIHTKEKLFKCDICKKSFGRSDVLTRHMITHSVDKPYACDFCKKSYGRFPQLIDHVKKCHSSSNMKEFIKQKV